MKSNKVTLDDIRSRKKEVLRQIRESRDEIKDGVFGLTHPFGRSGNRGGLPLFKNAVSAFNKMFFAYKFAYTVVSFVKRIRH